MLVDMPARVSETAGRRERAAEGGRRRERRRLLSSGIRSPSRSPGARAPSEGATLHSSEALATRGAARQAACRPAAASGRSAADDDTPARQPAEESAMAVLRGAAGACTQPSLLAWKLWEEGLRRRVGSGTNFAARSFKPPAGQ
jgi:hypothetical protein